MTNGPGAAPSFEPVLAERYQKPERPAYRATLAEALAFIRPFSAPESAPSMRATQSGNGQTVLVLPALGRGDGYTERLRHHLNDRGYSAHGWKLGVNLGPSRLVLDGLVDRLQELSGRDKKIAIVGFSLGGLFARWLALRAPDRISQIITVCSPIHDPARNFWLPIQSVLNLYAGDDLGDLARQIAQDVPVPCTAMFSRDDGIVNWRACIDHGDSATAIEIAGPHVAIARNPQAWAVITQRLAVSPLSTRSG